MAKKSGFVNVYTGLLAGAVGGWFLHGLTKKPKTTVVGTVHTDSYNSISLFGSTWEEPKAGVTTKQQYTDRLRYYFLGPYQTVTENDIQNYLSKFDDSYWLQS